jgi:hypothetical protein
MQDEINAIYEELIYLDEIAGELDPSSNAKIEARRSQLIEELRILENDPTEWQDIGCEFDPKVV